MIKDIIDDILLSDIFWYCFFVFVFLFIVFTTFKTFSPVLFCNHKYKIQSVSGVNWYHLGNFEVKAKCVKCDKEIIINE